MHEIVVAVGDDDENETLVDADDVVLLLDQLDLMPQESPVAYDDDDDDDENGADEG